MDLSLECTIPTLINQYNPSINLLSICPYTPQTSEVLFLYQENFSFQQMETIMEYHKLSQSTVTMNICTMEPLHLRLRVHGGEMGKKIVRAEDQRDFYKVLSPRNVRRCTYKLSAVQLLKLAEQD